MTTPSETLMAAADLIRDLAAKTVHDCAAESCGGWHEYRGPCGGCCSCLGSCVQEGPEPPAGSWWAAFSPDKAPLLADLLEAEAACIASVDDVKRIMPKILDGIESGAGDEDTTITVTIDTSGPALAFARAILGSGVDTP